MNLNEFQNVNEVSILFFLKMLRIFPLLLCNTQTLVVWLFFLILGSLFRCVILTAIESQLKFDVTKIEKYSGKLYVDNFICKYEVIIIFDFSEENAKTYGYYKTKIKIRKY